MSESPAIMVTGIFICLRLVGLKLCTKAGAITKAAFTSGIDISSPASATSDTTSGFLKNEVEFW